MNAWYQEVNNLQETILARVLILRSGYFDGSCGQGKINIYFTWNLYSYDIVISLIELRLGNFPI